MSRRPSRLTSRTAAVSLAPGSIAWIRNGTSGGRVAASESAAQARISRGARQAALTSTRAISSRPLEREPQRKLDDAVRAGAGGGDASEVLIGLLSGGVVEDGARVDDVVAVELARVERVVELGAELQVAPAEPEVLEQRDVMVDVPETVELVEARSAEEERVPRAAARLHALRAE